MEIYIIVGDNDPSMLYKKPDSGRFYLVSIFQNLSAQQKFCKRPSGADCPPSGNLSDNAFSVRSKGAKTRPVLG